MVEISARIVQQAIKEGNGAAAKYVEELANFGSTKGWEFQRIDTLSASENMGGPMTQFITFRRRLPEIVAPPTAVRAESTNEPERDLAERSGNPPEESDLMPAAPSIEEKPWWR